METDLTRPFIGYRSAGRRPESQQDRRAAADAPLSALRGMVSGVLGAPGDIESLIRMLPGLSKQTVLPTSEDIEKRLPMRELNQTPTGKAFTTAGQLGGGFYTGPGSPLRAVAALPSAVSRAGRDFALAGSPVHVVKPKGGNWLAGSVERAVEPMRAAPRPGQTTRQLAEMMPANEWIGLSDEAGQVSDYVRSLGGGKTEQLSAPDFAMNRWLETKLGKYMKNEMATPEDPLRALAERGVLHVDPQQIGLNRYLASDIRRKSGNPAMGESEAAKAWEDASDVSIGQMPAGELLRQGYAEQMPWLAKVPPETPVYLPSQSDAASNLGFSHLTDELRNAINPQSGLPENLLWKYSDLDKVTVPQAVERVAKINEWRAAQKAEADMARAMGPATQVVKEYPEQGYKWVELRQPKETGRTVSVEKIPDEIQGMDDAQARRAVEEMAYDEGLDPGTPEFNQFVEDILPRKTTMTVDESYKALEDALKYEGETMGHCVGGYCPDVVEGRSKIYSLRDKKGQPHVTIEVAPRNITAQEAIKMAISEGLPEKGMETFNRVAEIMGSGDFMRQDIVQIKGKGNKAPKEDYLPAVQDFVRSGNWSEVGDLQNTGLVSIDKIPEKRLYEAAGMKLPKYVTEKERDDLINEYNRLTVGPTDANFMSEAYGFPPPEGFSRGGAVRGYQAGGAARTLPELQQRYAEGGAVTGANFPTDDYDPARIDAIVAGLQAEMQS